MNVPSTAGRTELIQVPPTHIKPPSSMTRHQGGWFVSHETILNSASRIMDEIRTENSNLFDYTRLTDKKQNSNSNLYLLNQNSSYFCIRINKLWRPTGNIAQAGRVRSLIKLKQKKYKIIIITSYLMFGKYFNMYYRFDVVYL